MVYDIYMMGNYFDSMSNWMSSGNTLTWLMPLIILDLVLKGVALWKAGRNNQLYWFIALLLVNSIGILPIIYLVFFEKKKK